MTPSPPFSRRTAWRQELNPFTTALELARVRGDSLIDLTELNPTRVGLGWPEAALSRLYAAAPLGRYEPDPRGLPEVREEIAAYHSPRGRISPDDVIPTASTSEGYAFLLKLLCDPGDQILTFAPGYPLLEHLAEVEGVTPVSCAARASDDWAVPLDEVAARLAAPDHRIRAVALVNPQHPTGRFLRTEELEALSTLCAAQRVALISDEVFADYGRVELVSVAGRASPALTFCLSGLSKVAALPQLKLGWICVGGPAASRAEALRRLEFISDTFLSVSGPALAVAAEVLRGSGAVREQIRARLAQNRATLTARWSEEAAWNVVRTEGGWSALIRLPRHPGEEAVALRALEAGVVVHPGHFYDLGEPSLVLSLLPAPEEFAAGIDRLIAAL